MSVLRAGEYGACGTRPLPQLECILREQKRGTCKAVGGCMQIDACCLCMPKSE